jgi:hypothetical protein
VPLAPGARLGPYEIVSLLGAGGMGEVYRAHDTRLARDVAVKVLPSSLTRDPERLARFAQEAHATAALNHPNVVAVFDVGAEEEVRYVVSELLEGETLRTAVDRGPLSPRTAIDLAVQIAAGIAAAHQKGIVHRDLKPENVFITRDGRAKVLDFGLAKLAEGTAAATSSLATMALTSPGLVLGTAGYMSPEQVRGEPADHRADIFAFGAVLYEMLAGRRAFSGRSAIDTMDAILRQDPPPLPAGATHPALEQIARRCLEKNPVQRFQSAVDVGYALQALAGTASLPPAAPPVSVPRSTLPWRRVAAATALVAGGVAIGAVLPRGPAAVSPPVMRFEARSFDRWPVTNARFMPDGQTVVYSAAPQGHQPPELFSSSPAAEGPQALGVTGAHLLAVSRSGELAIIMEARPIAQRLYAGTLARMTIGSSPRPVMQDVREADWGPGGTLAVVHDLGNGRDRLEYPVGTALHEISGYLSDPRVSPDGTRVAFFEHQWRFDDRGVVRVVDRSGAVTTLSGELWGLQGLAWTPDGDTVVFSGNEAGGALMQPMAVPASGRGPARTVVGVPARFIVHDVTAGGRWLGVREDLAFGVRTGGADRPERDVSWLGSSGARSMSADGQWLLMVDVGQRSGRDYGVVLRKADGTQAIRLGDGSPQQLSPDGRWASAIRTAPAQVVLYPTGPGQPLRLPPGPLERLSSAAWFPDGTRLLVCGSEPARAPRCYQQRLDGSTPVPLTAEGADAALAPDGRTLLLTAPDGAASVSTVEGGAARPLPALRTSDRQIAWSGDSRAIFVQPGRGVPATVDRIDVVTGARTTVRRLAPEGLPAVASVHVTAWIDAGRWYAYNYSTLTSTLFVVTGAIH